MSNQKYQTDSLYVPSSQTSQQGLLIIDNQYLITNWGYALEEWFRISPDEAKGNSIFEIFQSIGGDEIKNLIQKPLYHHEITNGVLTLKDNLPDTFYVQSLPLLNHNGAQDGVQMIFQTKDEQASTSVSHRTPIVSDLLSLHLDQFTEGVFIIDQAGDIVQVNESALQSFGYTQDDLLGMPFYNLLHHDYAANFMNLYNLEVGHPLTSEYKLVTKQGQAKLVESTSFKLDDSHIQIVTRDLSNRQETDQNIQDSEEQYRLLFNFNPEPIIIYDADSYNILDVNQAASELYGYSKEAFTRLTVYDIRPDDEYHAFHNFFKNLTDENVNMGHWTHCKSDGTPFQVKVTSYALHMAEQNVRISMINDITDKVETEKSLKESEEKFEAITESSLVGIYMFQENTFDYINPSLADIFGYEQEDIIGKKGPVDFIHPDDWPLVQDKIQKLFSEELTSENITFRVLTKDYNIRHLEAFATTIQLHNQKVLTGTAIDVTERKEAEEDLIYNQKLLQNVFDQSQDALFIIRSEDEKIEDCNPMAVEMFNMDSKEELIGQSIFSLKGDDFTQEQLDEVKQQVSEGKKWSTDHLLKTRDNQKFWGSIVTKRFTLNNRTMSLVRITDIDEKMRDKQKLQEEQQFVQAITQNTPNIIHLYDVDEGVYVYANRNLVEFLGYTIEEVNQFENGIMDLFAKEDIPHHQNRLEDNLKLKDGEISTNEFRIQHKQGHWLWFISYDTVFKRDEKGNVKQILGTLQNITDRKNAELKVANFNEELELKVQERTKQLENANKELEAFNYTASHDLRNPVRAIDIFSSFLEKKYYDKIDDKGKDYIDQMRTSIRNINQLLDDLLAFSRLGRKQMNEAEVNMNELFHEVIEETRYHYQSINVPEIACNELHSVIADRNMLRQVVMNLIGNAFKFTKNRKGPKIKIGSYKEHEHIVYFVSDNGIGFKMEYAEKIFGVFERLHNETEYEGTGGGLSIVERIIQRHNGIIWAEGEKGAGSTFYFKLPYTTY